MPLLDLQAALGRLAARALGRTVLLDGDVRVPDPPPAPPPGLEQKIDTLLAWGKWGVLVCGVAGLFICAGQMAIGRKNRSTFAADGATGIPWVLGGLSLAATAAPIVGVFFK